MLSSCSCFLPGFSLSSAFLSSPPFSKCIFPALEQMRPSFVPLSSTPFSNSNDLTRKREPRSPAGFDCYCLVQHFVSSSSWPDVSGGLASRPFLWAPSKCFYLRIRWLDLHFMNSFLKRNYSCSPGARGRKAVQCCVCSQREMLSAGKHLKFLLPQNNHIHL